MSSQVRDLENSHFFAVPSSSSSSSSGVSKQLLNLLLRREVRDLFGLMQVLERGTRVVDGVVVECESGGEDRFEKWSGDTTCDDEREGGSGREGWREKTERWWTNTSYLEFCGSLKKETEAEVSSR